MVSAKASQKQENGLIVVYTVFLGLAVFVYHLIAEHEFSSVLTLAAIFQCLAFSLLGVQAISGSVKGISAKSLQLDAFALACRLSSTLFVEGYLPNDETGDWLYQAFDVLSLGMLLWVLYQVLTVQRQTYEADKDDLPAWPFALGSLILASMFHGNMDEIPILDTAWMCGVFVSAVAVLPQLWMVGCRHGSMSALTSHFVAVTAISRVLSGSYMWYAYPEIECDPWFEGFSHAGYLVIAAHVVHLVLLGDFSYYYVKNVTKSGLNAPLEFAETIMV